MLLLRCGDFERIIIFEREDDTKNFAQSSSDASDDEDGHEFEESDFSSEEANSRAGASKNEPSERPKVVNENKQRFLSVLHLVMTILTLNDEKLTGQVATYKKLARPSYVDLNEIEKLN